MLHLSHHLHLPVSADHPSRPLYRQLQRHPSSCQVSLWSSHLRPCHLSSSDLTSFASSLASPHPCPCPCLWNLYPCLSLSASLSLFSSLPSPWPLLSFSQLFPSPSSPSFPLLSLSSLQ